MIRYTRIDAKTDRELVSAAQSEGRTVSSQIALAIRLLVSKRKVKSNA